jgi:hypothetical protein
VWGEVGAERAPTAGGHGPPRFSPGEEFASPDEGGIGGFRPRDPTKSRPGPKLALRARDRWWAARDSNPDLRIKSPVCIQVTLAAHSW